LLTNFLFALDLLLYDILLVWKLDILFIYELQLP